MSSEVSSIQKDRSQGWVEAGLWLDVVFGSMVIVSLLGLAYTFLIS